MKNILAAILILLGGWLIYVGHERADSVAGRTHTLLVDLKNDIDGKNRVAGHVKFYVGGAVLLVAGGWLLLRKR